MTSEEKFKVWWDEKEGIIRNVSRGDFEQEDAKMLKSDKIAQHAFVGMRTLTRVIVSFLTKASGAKNAMFFTTEEEALRWLKGGGDSNSS
jgi:hypothetical protein